MRRKSYPLDPLVQVRKSHVDAATAGLAAAVRAREDAAQTRLALEAEHARQAQVARQARDAEAEALTGGALSVVDLQRQGAWEARAQWEAEEQARRIAQAKDHEARAEGGEQRAMADLAHAEANARAVAQHKERWAREREQRAERAAEESATEAWRPRR